MEDLEKLLAGYPSEVTVDAAEVAAGAQKAAGYGAGDADAAPSRVFIVLDDDPTGTQSVSGLPVLTAWQEDDFKWALETGSPAVYVLTNSRSLGEDDAAERNREVVANALAAAAGSDLRLSFVSRSDSTMRGHFPLETDVLTEAMTSAGQPAPDGVVMVPAFPDAGRITIGSVHYTNKDGALTPVAETEFAKDATFGYQSSNLKNYVDEKSAGRFPASDVIALTLDIIRAGAGPIARQLAGAHNGIPVVADAVTEDDLRLLTLGVQEAESAGKKFLYRVGPPFPRAAIGQEPHAPLTAGEAFGDNDETRARPGGLIVVGSHVGMTTRQLDELQATRPIVHTAELDVAAIIDEEQRAPHVYAVVSAVAEGLKRGDVIIHTSRKLVTADTGDASLDISRRVSAAVVDVVRRVLAAQPPRFVIAKGGITSSDVASKGLQIRRAMVSGPMLPGIVPLWKAVDGPAQGIPYVVFPGNVGGDRSLVDVVATLSSTSDESSTRADQ
ncbi:four-carbon acid sugar kinase family protein [Arthrobacter castelli]|uniref:four-carbon acid sugar kinase family protein n=1 Tax=Arthrobacter castelli TaxID=271431 RepID=UPI0003FB06B7|nr:four-carbon acid sugar kinase family protein [Arthrobacter castelli]